MKRIILTIATLVLAVVPVMAKQVKGRVCGEGKPLSGVIVSDGYRFAKTGNDGRFKFNTHKDARFVFVVTPSCYVADYSSGVPAFYLPVKGKSTFNFNLNKLPESNGYSIFSVSDPQMQNDKHFKLFCGKPLGDLCGMAKKYSSRMTTIGIALGDVAWNHLETFERYKGEIARTGIPFYAVIGNHDHIQNLSGAAAVKAYEDAFGPCNYAFFLGEDLVIGVDNIIFKASGKDDPHQSSNNYREGYSQEVLNFVKGLLACAGKVPHVYIAQHSPMVLDKEMIEGADRLIAILDGYEVDVLSGHTHTMNKVKVTDSIRDNNAAAIGGAWWATKTCTDGTPRGYEIITVSGDERSFRWHNIDFPDDYQVEFTGMGLLPLHRNSVGAYAWAEDGDWNCTWTQDGVEMGNAKLCSDRSRTYTEEISAVYKGDYSKIPGYKRPEKSGHYFIATPSQYAEKVSMTVSAPDGRSWTHEFDLRGSYTDLQAHRGGAGLMPENTISAMKNALRLCVNTLEFDLQLSSDRKVVVSHDNYFHPRYSMRPDSSLVEKGDPKEYLFTMPYDSIAKYDVGLRPVKNWPEQKKISEHKPLAGDLIDFAEAYSAAKGLSPVRYNIEIKSREGDGEGTLWPGYEEFCDVCIPLLLSKNLGDRLVVQSFDVRALRYIHEKYPKVKLSYLTENEENLPELLDAMGFLPEWWSPHFSVVTPSNVAYCHALGIRVVPWTVDDPAIIRKMLDCEVDAIISNYPDRLIEVCR